MRKRGFTLIELLAVIVVLATTATIATPMVLNTIEYARKGAAESSMSGYIKAIENKIASGLISESEYEDKEYGYKDIAVNIKGTQPTGGRYILEDGVVKLAKFCINGYETSYQDGEVSVLGNCTGEDMKYEGRVVLSRYSGYHEPNKTGTFEVMHNASGGALSCTSSDEEVATCSITGNVVTVNAGTKVGSATLTITAEGNSNYKESSAAYLVMTDQGLLGITSNGYTGVYDGKAHGITVSVAIENAIIKYGETEENYNLDTSPTLTDVGTKIVYYQIIIDDYLITGSEKVDITKASGSVAAPTAKTLTYIGNPQELVEAGSSSTGTIKYRLEGGEYSESIPTAKNVGKYKVYYMVEGDLNHNDVEEAGPIEVSIGKGNNTLTLSTNSGSYTYPEGGTFEVTENSSDGELTCTSNNKEVADCSIEGTIVTVILGTEEGFATLTITSAATDNYNEGKASYLVTTGKGLLSYTATGYSGVYDGNPHRIIVTASGATITYSTDGVNYVSTNPEYTNVGEYTVYYKIEQAGYNTIQGTEHNAKVVITKADGDIVVPTAKTLTYTGEAQELIIAGSSSTGTIKYSLDGINYSESIPTGTNVGEYTVYYKVEGDPNHNDVGADSIKVTISAARLNYTTGGYTGVYDRDAHGITVISENATIKYGTENGVYTLDTSPVYSDAGEYTVYYQITREGYITESGSEKVVITKANNTLTLSASTGSYTYPNGGTFEITENASGGKLTCTSDNKDVADCLIEETTEGTIVKVILGTTEGYATLTITSEATNNYNEGKAAYVANSSAGLMSYTAIGYKETYDGEAHGITVTASGATITYGTTKGTYDLNESPIYTNAGEYEVFYKIEQPGYRTIESSEKVIIEKADGSFVVIPTAKTTLTYTGSAQALINEGSSNTGTIQYKVSDGSYSTTSPTRTDAGTYTVCYKVVGDANHNDIVEKCDISVTIAKATNPISVKATQTWEPTFSTSAETKDITAASGNQGAVTYTISSQTNSSSTAVTYFSISGTTVTMAKNTPSGTYKVKITASAAGNSNYNSGSKTITLTVTVSKKANTLILSSNAATYKYPNSGTFTVDTNTSEGTLSCTSSNEAIATCSISGTTVTVTPGTTNGSATITITSAETANYKPGQAAHVATTEPGLLTVTASDYNKPYDGNPHGITVTASGATIKYGESSGSYTLDSSPTLTNVGTKTVYYQVTRAGYATVTGSKTITITKATNPIAVTATQTWKPTFKTSAQTQAITAATKAQGTVTYTIASQVNSSSTAVTHFSISGTTVTAKASTPAGTYTVKITATAAGNSNYNSGSKTITLTVTVGKANNTLTLSSNAATYKYPNSGTFTVDTNTSEGTLSCKSSNESYATCSISGNTVTVTPVVATANGSATITVTSAATTNYNSATASHVATTNLGTLSVTASNYNKAYDGAAHGITVTCSGATIKYGEASGTYNLTSSPTLTNVGTKTVYYQVTKTGYKTVTGSKTITITKATNPISFTAAQSWSRTFETSAESVNLPQATGAQGTITYAINSQKDSSGTAVSYFTLSERTLTAKASTPVGTYTVVVRATAAGNGNYNSGYKDMKVTVTVAKATNPITVTASQTWNTTYLTSDQTKTITGATNAQGSSVTYAISSQANSSGTAVSYFSISSTKVTAKANTPVGTYTVKIKATANGNSNYNSGSKTITLTVTVDKSLNSAAKVGDYVTMTPTATSYTITTSLTGYSSNQTINPSELNLWRIIRKNSDGTIEMVSQYVSSKNIYFYGQSGYLKYVGSLNTIANQYTNTKYTTGARHMGYGGQTATISNTTKFTYPASLKASTANNNNEIYGGGDVMYTTDTNLVTNAVGDLIANKVGTTTATSYHLASRHYQYDSATAFYWCRRYVYTDGVIHYAFSNLYGYQNEWISWGNDGAYAIRPIVTMKANIAIKSGAGTSASPWVLK